MNIRPATSEDVARILDLERSSPAAAHWEESRYGRLFPPSGDAGRLVLVAETVPQSHATPVASVGAIPSVIGFLVALHVASEWELENIAVDPAFQRQGIGNQLLDALFGQARQVGSESIYLEVRESNNAARGLYKKAGFKPTGRRKAYYSNPSEDAVLYRKQLI